MRRQGGYYGGDSGGGGRQSYGGPAAQMQQHNRKSGYYQGPHPEEQALGDTEGGPPHDDQWRWERDGAQDKLPQTAMSPTPFSEGRESPRSYYQSQRMDPRMSLERQSGDPRSQPHEEDMDIGYKDNRGMQNFERLQERFLDDIMKLSKEQTDAEDTENARHRKRINAINTQYEEQLLGLRAQLASRRDELLRQESQARQQQYQQMVMKPYPTGNNSKSYKSYVEGSRFPSNDRDHGYETKIQHPKSRAHNPSSLYY